MGVKVAEASYKNGKKDGKWFVWDDEGNLKYELCYKDGEKTGTWKSYNEMGVVINERDYTEF
jgi:antitoxin component YwqK of YwqJK toxin-antitoxin module